MKPQCNFTLIPGENCSYLQAYVEQGIATWQWTNRQQQDGVLGDQPGKNSVLCFSWTSSTWQKQ